jgi:hypothetical protein
MEGNIAKFHVGVWASAAVMYYELFISSQYIIAMSL